MKKITYIIATTILAISCKNLTKQDTNEKLQQYTLTLYKHKFEPKKRLFLENDSVYKVQSINDTTAYLLALTNFYNEQVKQRASLNFGQPSDFLIVDKNNINLSLKLSSRIVEGLQQQVKSQPEIKKMLFDYQRDSLIVDTDSIKNLINKSTRNNKSR